MKKQILSGIAGFAFTALAAHGAIVTETVTFGPTAIGAPSFTVPLHKFNGLLGTLNSIKFELEVTDTATMKFDNESNSPGTVSLQVGTTVQSSVGTLLLSQISVSPTKSGSGSVLADNDGAPDFLGTDSFSISGGATATNSLLRNTAPYIAQLEAPNGTFTYPVTITNSAISNASTSGILGTTNASGTFSGKVTVIYTYNTLAAVPEAGTVFFGASLAMLLAFRRQRTRVA
jgi:hypothetical protein